MTPPSGQLHRWVTSASVAALPEEPAVNATDERLTELEIRFAHQGRLLEELSDELLGCFRRIEALERENRRLGETLSRMAPELDQSPDE